MNHEFFEALYMLEKERNVPVEHLVEKIKTAISIAVRRDMGNENNIVEIDPETERFYVALRKTVVEDVENDATEMTKTEALKYDKKAKIGDNVEIPLETKQFGRIAAQAAKHVIRQGIREAEKGILLQEYQSRQHDIVSAVVLKLDPKRGNATLEIANSEAVLPKYEQVPTEILHEGDRIKVYVVDVSNSEKGPRLMLSRTHPGLVKRLFEMQVPEIFDGLVEIKSISREAGSRTKIAVSSRDENVDPVGACIGPKGARVTAIGDELGGEKIDVIPYSDDPVAFIAASLSPAKVVEVQLSSDGQRVCRVIVPDHQLSLAIGNKGQNARLAAKLTGWKIDIRPESGFYGEEESGQFITVNEGESLPGATVEEIDGAEEKPKAKRSRKKADDIETTDEAMTEAADETVTEAQVTEEAPAEVEEKPKAKRSRKKADDIETADEAVIEAADEGIETQGAEETSAEVEEEPKAKRSRKKAGVEEA